MSPSNPSAVRGWRKSAVALLSAGALALTAACSGGSTGGDDGSLQIGMLTAQTGPLSGAGNAYLSGAEVAVDLIDQKDYIGGGKTIELVTQEGAEDPQQSASAASQLAANPDILGMLCCILSPVAGAVKPATQSRELPLIIYGATEPGLAEPPYVFRTTTMPQPANEALARAVAEQTDVETVVHVVMSDNDGILSQAESFKDGFAGSSIQEIGQVDLVSAQSNFDSSASQAIGLAPDAITVSATQSEALGMISALHNRGYDGLILSTETILGQGVYDSNPEALEPVPFPGYFTPEDTTELGAEFAQAYEEKTGRIPDNFAAQGFNAVWIMATALKDAGDAPTRQSLTDALNGLTEVTDTVYGTVRFEDGQMFAEESIAFMHYSSPNGDVVRYEFN